MPLNVLHFTATDSGGGAAKAAHRIHQAQRAGGMRSTMFVARKETDDPDVIQVPVKIDRSQYRRMRWRQRLGLHQDSRPIPDRMFNFDLEPDLDTDAFFQFPRGAVDVLMLHWITGLLTVDTIHRLHQRYGCHVVWILMDMEPITGGCHYSFGCVRFTQQCGHCPQIEPRGESDASRKLWERKARLLKAMPITFIAANTQARKQITSSSLFGNHPIADIRVPLKTEVFRPLDRRIARNLLQVPQDAYVVFFGASSVNDPRKGTPELAAALRLLHSRLEPEGTLAGRKVVLLVAGRNPRHLTDQQPFPAIHTGLLGDDLTLALAYQASDVYACPSVEDGGPMMVSEAMLCGTPVVAFRHGIAPELVEHRINGYLAELRNVEDFARGIEEMLRVCPPCQPLLSARESAMKEHSPEIVAKKYRELFESLARG